MKGIKTVWFDHRTDLPIWITSRVGQIVVEWSALERELEELIQMLVNTDIGFTRIMVNRLNARNRISAAHSLIEWYVFHKRIGSSFLEQFNKIGNRVNKTQTRRDMVAHGLWSRKKRKVVGIKAARSKTDAAIGAGTQKVISRVHTAERAYNEKKA
jgi:hypothetical protein